ncbi:MAG: hypothetical protein CL908_20785 [Deltaproteobacteria bacterium]|jgi:hypothetical protein|nr:hypothetical protein [Deltaproteobacteria bacterium]
MRTDSIVRLAAKRSQSLRGRRSSRTSRNTLPYLFGILLLSGTGCLTPPSIVVEDLLEPLAQPRPWLPGPADLAAAKLARAALIGGANAWPVNSGGTPTVDPSIELALAALEEAELSEENEDLLPLAIDLRNATLDDPIAYRSASRTLRKRFGIDPRLEGRLDRTIDDDPLRLARRRQSDGWHRLWARSFNTVSEPLGGSLITGFVLLPFQLVNSIIHYFAEFSNSEPLSPTDRQALALRRDFLARHPDTELTESLERRVEKDLAKLEETLARRRVRAAERAFDSNDSGLALHQARTALEILSPHPEKNSRLRGRAAKLEDRASKAVADRDRLEARSLTARRSPPEQRQAELRLATWILEGPLRPNELEAELTAYREFAGPDRSGRIDFIRAMAQNEAGFEAEGRERLARLAGSSADGRDMGRHARTLLDDDWQNPHGAFEELRRKGVREEVAWRLAGEWVRRPRYPNLPTPVAYLIETPTIAMTIILAPLRALISPWTGTPDFQRGAALAGYRYLVRYPDGSEQRPLIDWLYDYEHGRERWSRALRLADLTPDFDPEQRAQLVDDTATAQLERLDEIDRRDARTSTLEGIAREFPDSEGGREAGLLARAEYEDASPQHIRITKSFLLENPSVAGRAGMGLHPGLLNDDPADGELHPDGVLLRGGRLLEILLVAEGAEDDDPPESRLRKISKQRLSRIASTLEESVRRNSLIDVDARHEADATRDVYLERAGLEVTGDADRRPSAESTFVYQSLRERYGMVRGRDSVLPFDLVFRGSLGDFTLGAFPRWRPPRETPDAFLYR